MSCPVANISVLKCVGASPGFRDSAALLFEHVVEGNCEVVLNFEGVTFISRGFADELHQVRKRFQTERAIPVTIEHANGEVMAMLEAVARTQNGVVRPKTVSKVIRVSDTQGLEDLLLSSS